MDIYKRTDGRSPYWQYDAIDPATGRRIRKSTGLTDKRAALRKAFEEVEKLTPQEAPPDHRETLAVAAEKYVARMKADGKTSWPTVEGISGKTFGKVAPMKDGRPRFALAPETFVSDLTKDSVETLRIERAKEGNKPGTIAAELRVLRAICLYSAQRGRVPAPVIKWGIPKRREKLRYLSPDEAMRVLRRLHPDTAVKAGSKGKLVVPKGRTRSQRQDTHDLFLALVLTGGRWNEVAKLTRSQVDLGRRVVTLYGWKGSAERTVPMVSELYEMFSRRLAEAGPALIFPGKEKAGGLARSSPTRAIRRAMTAEECNTPESVAAFGMATNHSLRHTYASWLRQRGLALDEVQPLLGHSEIRTTMIYARIIPETALEKARTSLEQLRLAPPAIDGQTDPLHWEARGRLPAIINPREEARMELLSETAPLLGTNAADLADVRYVLREDEGWVLEVVHDPEGYDWIAAAAPDGSEWLISREDGTFRAVCPNEDDGAGITGRATAADAATDLRAFVGVALVKLSDLPPRLSAQT